VCIDSRNILFQNVNFADLKLGRLVQILEIHPKRLPEKSEHEFSDHHAGGFVIPISNNPFHLAFK
jgi:hypothetical protein